MRVFMKQLTVLVWLTLPLSIAANAEVRLPNVLSDHAVLQRDQPVHVWGWAAPAEKVTVQFHSQTQSTIADKIGAWEVSLMPEAAGGPYTLSVSGSETEKPLERRDILVGDVWVASGQSNMEFPMKGFPKAPLKNGDQEIANANHPKIRLLLVKRAISDFPLDDVDGTWTACTPETVASFSAVAYFFGREISERENVPIGLIDSSWGGTPALPWVSMGALGDNDFTPALRLGKTAMDSHALVQNIRANFAAQNEVLKAQGKPPLTYPHQLIDYPQTPAELYNGMIAPLTRYTIKGAIWYQGESDSGPDRAGAYRRLFSILINSWRDQWHEGDFPFLFVQLSSSTVAKGDWFRIRDAQRQVLNLRHTEMAVSLDLGNPDTVHPPNKQTVGMRLALAALGSVYGEKIGFVSPQFHEATTEDQAIRIWLTDAQGLTSRGQPLKGFEISGKDQKFVPANAKIETIGDKETIVISAPTIVEPEYVRYGWSNMVTHYLYNNAGLPLGTFSSEVYR